MQRCAVLVCGGQTLPALVTLLLLLASAAAAAPLYEGDPALEPQDLVPFEQDSVRMGIPQGYSAQALPAAAGAALKHWFVNRRRSANFQVYCYAQDIDKSRLQKDVELAAVGNLSHAVQTVPTQAIDASSAAAEFAAYEGTTEVQGRIVPLTILVAWKMPARSGGCKYGLLAVIGSPAAAVFLPEFVAIVRSLQ